MENNTLSICKSLLVLDLSKAELKLLFPRDYRDILRARIYYAFYRMYGAKLFNN